MKDFSFNKNKSVQVNVRVSEDMDYQIKQIAEKEDVEKTEAIRALLEHALNDYYRQKL